MPSKSMVVAWDHDLGAEGMGRGQAGVVKTLRN